MKISSVLLTALFAALVTAGHVHNDDNVSAHGKMKRQAVSNESNMHPCLYLKRIYIDFSEIGT